MNTPLEDYFQKMPSYKAMYEQNNQLTFVLTEPQYKLIKQLIRMQLAELIENDASDEKIDQFTVLDVDFNGQYNETMRLINLYDRVDDDELPF
jgi:hypothetical protein